MNIIYLIDFNCPFSYIGLERLKKATEKLNIDVKWEFKPFELEPSAKKRPAVTTTEIYAKKHELSLEDASYEISEIEQIALEDGLKINYKNMLFTSSKMLLDYVPFVRIYIRKLP